MDYIKMNGYIYGDLVVQLPSKKEEYEKYFQSDKVSFEEAENASKLNKYRVPSFLLKQLYKEEIMDLYNNCGDKLVDVDAAGLKFKYPVFANTGIKVDIDGNNFFIPFSNLSKLTRNIIIDELFSFNHNRDISIELDKASIDLLKKGLSLINDKTRPAFNVLYEVMQYYGDVTAFDKVFTALANMEKATSFASLQEMGKWYADRNGLTGSYDEIGQKLIDGIIATGYEFYDNGEYYIAIPEIDLEAGLTLRDKMIFSSEFDKEFGLDSSLEYEPEKENFDEFDLDEER